MVDQKNVAECQAIFSCIDNIWEMFCPVVTEQWTRYTIVYLLFPQTNFFHYSGGRWFIKAFALDLDSCQIIF